MGPPSPPSPYAKGLQSGLGRCLNGGEGCEGFLAPHPAFCPLCAPAHGNDELNMKETLLACAHCPPAASYTPKSNTKFLFEGRAASR
jgi:hypothetical protein